LFNSILWFGSLIALYLAFIVSTPKKAPEPIREAFKVEVTQADIDKQKAAAAASNAPVAKKAEPEVIYNEVDLAKGKELYLAQCIRCHNADPNIKGPIGPEMVDAPLDVMKYKVATGRYPDVLPEGFVPKRTTKQMTKLPAVVPDVPSIHAYVQSLKKK